MQPSQRIVSQMLLRQTPTSPLRHETLHQGAIEDIFLDNMRDMGVEVSRPVIPTSLEVVLEHEDTETKDERRTEITKIGAHSWVRKSMGIAMQEEQTEYVWGVVDLVPDTDFPDIRNKCPIHSNNGSCMIIPREDHKIHLYIQLDGKDVIDASGRVDKSKAGPEMILDVARKTLHPFTIKTQKSYDWWTIYVTGQRVAEHYTVHNRVFIAGDVCHSHSPDFDKFSKLFSGKPYSELNLDGLSKRLADLQVGWVFSTQIL
ncbi:hypothetical protein F5051DRAFT_446710 [Lentinula edodes]|nr:hypothetical protein F5051DRAFT_446710 [Lentinula edodes]